MIGLVGCSCVESPSGRSDSRQEQNYLEAQSRCAGYFGGEVTDSGGRVFYCRYPKKCSGRLGRGCEVGCLGC